MTTNPQILVGGKKLQVETYNNPAKKGPEENLGCDLKTGTCCRSQIYEELRNPHAHPGKMHAQ